jgi:DNA-binding beta-propeller fold protein YncE
MKNICLLTIFSLLIVSCNQENNNNIAYRISEKDLIPEGITYSSTTNSFYLSSIFKTKIIQIDAETGEFKDFIPSDLLNLSFLGLFVDETRNHLWACGIMSQNDNTESMVSKFNLITGELLKTYSYSDTVSNTYNDLVQDGEGNVYFTDSDGQCVCKIDIRTDSVTVFFDGIEILHPNGITISPDNKYLYVASNDKGIRVLDIGKRKIIGEPDPSFDSKGIDGLKYYRNSLIGIQNEVKTRSDVKIARYYLDNTGTKITGMKIIDQDNSNFDIPTTFTIVKNNIYCLANSQLWNISSGDMKIIKPENLKEVLILRYRIN